MRPNAHKELMAMRLKRPVVPLNTTIRHVGDVTAQRSIFSRYYTTSYNVIDGKYAATYAYSTHGLLSHSVATA
ncbi:hypothetical protein SPBR_09102 [Sporothrix brasiliensis 5110]|uniref:Uncharacterized protein n=1 Tax=Sporothrix brasiliensis 5110 TaxID=1398154 RepID=A0A0C2IS92_9PEZI|nr:uncharacterized protein SPBR_09102 [Sporothrix brasiliensis 5110]KIH91896.1 hypothetical protein SPBR_09102 [Sporothrix brasiliensis 5110]